MVLLEELIIEEMISLGLNPFDREDVINFWKGKLDD